MAAAVAARARTGEDDECPRSVHPRNSSRRMLACARTIIDRRKPPSSQESVSRRSIRRYARVPNERASRPRSHRPGHSATLMVVSQDGDDVRPEPHRNLTCSRTLRTLRAGTSLYYPDAGLSSVMSVATVELLT